MSQKTKRRFYVVQGAGDFPHDMLRYDESFPAREKDSGRMEGLTKRKRRVMLATDSAQAPNAERWKSFLWEVVVDATTDEFHARERADSFAVWGLG